MKTTPKGQKTREIILKYGLNLLQEYGFEGVSYARLNYQFNISSQHANYYFGSNKQFRYAVAQFALKLSNVRPVPVAFLILADHQLTKKITMENKSIILIAALSQLEFQSKQ